MTATPTPALAVRMEGELELDGRVLRSSDIGREVEYRGGTDLHLGKLTGWSATMVFVRFDGDLASKSCVPWVLKWSPKP